jgi:hypothetical protein
MPAPILLAAAICADWLVSFRSVTAIAKYFETEPADAQKALAQIHALTYRGQLEAALASPHERPDLIAQKTHLARMECQLAISSQQFERADSRVRRLRSLAEGCDERELFEAEKFANRVHQQHVRLIKDIQKAHKELEKAAERPFESHKTSAAAAPAVSTAAAPQIEQPSAQPTALEQPAPLDLPAAETVETPDMTNTKQENAEQEDNAQEDTAQENNAQGNNAPADTVSPSAAPPITEEERMTCFARHRNRIKNTPFHLRQSLINQLIEEQRAKSKPRAA